MMIVAVCTLIMMIQSSDGSKTFYTRRNDGVGGTGADDGGYDENDNDNANLFYAVSMNVIVIVMKMELLMMQFGYVYCRIVMVLFLHGC